MRTISDLTPIIGEDSTRQLITLLEAAGNENRQFESMATEIILLLFESIRDGFFPTEFLDLYPQLAATVDHDLSGQLVLSPSQAGVMRAIRSLMGSSGLLVQLPETPTMNDMLRTVSTRELGGLMPLTPFLDDTLHRTLLEHAGEEVDIWRFIGLIGRGLMSALDCLDPTTDEGVRTIGLTALLTYPAALIESFVDSPIVAEYALRKMRLAQETARGRL